MKRILLLFSIILFISCGNSKNSAEFIKAVSGNYLFNSDESIGISFNEGKLVVRWRGKEGFEPLKVNDSTFYLQEMNERFVFKMKPTVHIKLAPKREHDGKIYIFSKLADGEKTPREYLLNKEYEKALLGYKAIQQKDSLDRTIRERTFNRLGYKMIKGQKIDEAIEIFKINTKMYPNSSNTYDSLADGYLKKNDTVNAIINYKKALSINPENRSSKRNLDKITKK